MTTSVMESVHITNQEVAQVLRITENGLYRRKAREGSAIPSKVTPRHVMTWATQLQSTATPSSYAELYDVPVTQVYSQIKGNRLPIQEVAGVKRIALRGIVPTQAQIDAQILAPKPDDTPDTLFERNEQLCINVLGLTTVTGKGSQIARARLADAIDAAS